MVFFYKLGENKDEITNGAVAEDGFKVDFKNSYFLSVSVKKDILVDNNGILTLDTRFNKAVSDGDEFKDEGLYTITVSNQYTKEQVTKKISVGRNKILNVYAAHYGTVDPNEIAKQLDQGVEINDQWMMVLPEAKAEDSYNSQENDYGGLRTVDSASEQKTVAGKGLITPFNIAVFALAVIVLIMILKVVEKKKNAGKKDDLSNVGSENSSDQSMPKLPDKNDPDDTDSMNEEEKDK